MSDFARIEQVARVPRKVVERINELGYRTYREFAEAKGLPVDSFYALDCNKFMLADGVVFRPDNALRKIAEALGWKFDYLSELMIASHYSINGCGPVDINRPYAHLSKRMHDPKIWR
ncbi:MAG TPA: hypothetical protein V6C76_15710 [Drouetiella sp.]